MAGSAASWAVRGKASLFAIRNSSFSKSELAIIAEAKGILSSSEIALIRAAHQSGKSATINVGGRLIQYEPGLPASGMTMFGKNGFVIGREAFKNVTEFNKTILHELHRLRTSATNSTASVTGAQATAETKAAFEFAERAAGAL